jgi:outer membrane protein TolC
VIVPQADLPLRHAARYTPRTMPRRFRLSSRATALVLALGGLCGCAMQSYRAAPIDATTSARSFEARTLGAPELKEYMLANGSIWPVEHWGRGELTVVAFHYHSDLRVARAQAKAVRAEGAAATPRLPLGLTPRLEHHSLRTADQSSPWSLGFEIEIPLSYASTGEAIRSRHDALAQAAELKIGAAAWEVRARVRARLLDLYGSQAEAQLLEQETAAREALLKLLEQRLHAGAASTVEVNNARLALIDVQSRLQVARSAHERAFVALAEALCRIAAGRDCAAGCGDASGRLAESTRHSRQAVRVRCRRSRRQTRNRTPVSARFDYAGLSLGSGR